MKNYYFLIFGLLFFHVRCSAQHTDFLKPDSVVSCFLGKELSSILYSADSVYAYALNPLKSTDTTEYVLMRNAGKINENYSSILLFLMQSKINYGFDAKIKECKFLPQVKFRFFKDSEFAEVLLCLDCETWEFVYQDRHLLQDFTCKPMLIEYLRPIFPELNLLK